MNLGKIGASGFALGAACMYFSDPNRGKLRRAVARDKAGKTWNRVTSLADKAQRDLFNRVEGAFCGLTSALEDHQAEDDVLVDRVRSRVGRAVSHPHPIEVRAIDGTIMLSGPVLAVEVDALLKAVRSVPGVKDVVNQLEIHAHAGTFASLQGGIPRESRSEWTQQNWSPALRMAVGTAGGALLCYGARKRGLLRTASTLTGVALLTRSIYNREFREIVGGGTGTRWIRIDKDLAIHAPVEEIFGLWSEYSLFPCFMTNLKEVRDLGDGKSHWVAEGPLRIPVSWEAEVTKCVPNKLLAWRSLPGSAFENEGSVRFDQDGDGRTRVSLRMFYKPPAGLLGDGLASLLGSDPKQAVDDAMVRLKSLIELGHTRAHGRAVTLTDLHRVPQAS